MRSATLPRKAIRVWTIQPLQVLVRLAEEQVLYADPHQIPEEFRHAYDWMRDQMWRRIHGYSGRYPWWGWASPCPDLRQSGHLPRGTRGVRLELALAPVEVLLSDFDAWHVVLNHGYLALSENEEEEWDQRFETAVPNRLAWPPPEPWYADILDSWERIFQLEVLTASDYWGAGPRYIQATFETLRLADVRRRTLFVAR